MSAVGGFGSGRHQGRGAKKRRVEEHVALKLTELQHKGALMPGASGTLSWNDEGETRVAFRATATDFTLEYQVDDGTSAKPIVERVPLTRVAAGFGGTRRYFQCPRPNCRRQVMVLYLASGRFYCRHCHGLAYESQCENAQQLIERHADKARALLGYPTWRPFERAPIVRPRGMWRRKFWRLQHAVEMDDDIANASREMELRTSIDRAGELLSRGRKT
jgi:hypothetical protein